MAAQVSGGDSQAGSWVMGHHGATLGAWRPHSCGFASHEALATLTLFLSCGTDTCRYPARGDSPVLRDCPLVAGGRSWWGAGPGEAGSMSGAGPQGLAGHDVSVCPVSTSPTPHLS